MQRDMLLLKVPILCFLLKRKNVSKLSEQRLAVEGGMVPFPLYTCVHVKKDVSALSYSGKSTKYADARLRLNRGHRGHAVARLQDSEMLKFSSLDRFHTRYLQSWVSKTKYNASGFFAASLHSHCGKTADCGRTEAKLRLYYDNIASVQKLRSLCGGLWSYCSKVRAIL